MLLVWAERSEAEQSEDIHRMLVRQFRRITGSTAQEALYYLEQYACPAPRSLATTPAPHLHTLPGN